MRGGRTRQRGRCAVAAQGQRWWRSVARGGPCVAGDRVPSAGVATARAGGACRTGGPGAVSPRVAGCVFPPGAWVRSCGAVAFPLRGPLRGAGPCLAEVRSRSAVVSPARAGGACRPGAPGAVSPQVLAVAGPWRPAGGACAPASRLRPHCGGPLRGAGPCLVETRASFAVVATAAREAGAGVAAPGPWCSAAASGGAVVSRRGRVRSRGAVASPAASAGRALPGRARPLPWRSRPAREGPAAEAPWRSRRRGHRPRVPAAHRPQAPTALPPQALTAHRPPATVPAQPLSARAPRR